MNRNLLSENQLLPKSLFHPRNIFECKFEDYELYVITYYQLKVHFLHYFKNR